MIIIGSLPSSEIVSTSFSENCIDHGEVCLVEEVGRRFTLYTDRRWSSLLCLEVAHSWVAPIIIFMTWRFGSPTFFFPSSFLWSLSLSPPILQSILSLSRPTDGNLIHNAWGTPHESTSLYHPSVWSTTLWYGRSHTSWTYQGSCYFARGWVAWRRVPEWWRI